MQGETMVEGACGDNQFSELWGLAKCALNKMKDGVVLLGEKGEVLFVNTEAERLAGATNNKDLVGCNLLEWKQRGVRDEVLNVLDGLEIDSGCGQTKSIETGFISCSVTRCNTTKGNVVILSTEPKEKCNIPLPGEDGATTFPLNRWNRNMFLWLGDHLLSKLLHNPLLCIFEVHLDKEDKKLLFASQSLAQEVFQLPHEQVEGKFYRDLGYPQESISWFISNIGARQRIKGLQTKERLIRMPLNSPYVTTVVQYSYYLGDSEAGHPVYFSLITDITRERKMSEKLQRKRKNLESEERRYLLQNITTQKMLQQQLQLRTEELEEAINVNSRFLAVMSHEIRTPLSGMLGMLNLVAGTSGLSHEQKEMIDTAEVCGQHLLLLINEILDLSKLEEGKMEIEKLPTSLPILLQEVLEIVSFEADKKEVELLYETCCTDEREFIPDTIVLDTTRVRQVLVNLLNNAIKFSHKKGKVILRICAQVKDVIDFPEYPSEENRPKSLVNLVFSVQDEGIGIPEDVKGRLFKPFQQADSSTTRKYGGIGLGLSISKKLAELMGGTIWFSSEQGKGSIFHMSLNNLEFKETDPLLLKIFGSIRVLVVHSNETVLRDISCQLKKWGLSVISVSSWGSALPLLEPPSPDHVFHYVFLDSKGFRKSGLKAEELKKMIPGNLVLIGVLNKDIGSGLPFLKIPLESNQLKSLFVDFPSSPTIVPSPPPSPSPSLDSTPLHILVAEDNPVNQTVIKRLLRNMSYQEVKIVSNGKEAVEAVMKSHFDIVLMDIMMPEMGGLEATLQIKKQQHACTHKPVIIALTANAFEEEKRSYIAAGMHSVVSKPINRAVLSSILKQFTCFKTRKT